MKNAQNGLGMQLRSIVRGQATVALDDSLRVWSLELFTQVYSLALGLVPNLEKVLRGCWVSEKPPIRNLVVLYRLSFTLRKAQHSEGSIDRHSI